MSIFHLLHIVAYLHHLNYDPVWKIYRSHLVKIGLWETNHLALFLLAAVCLHIYWYVMAKSQTYFLSNWYWVEQYLDGSYFSLLHSQENQRSEMYCFSYLMRQTQVWKDVQTQQDCYSRYLNILCYFKSFNCIQKIFTPKY